MSKEKATKGEQKRGGCPHPPEDSRDVAGKPDHRYCEKCWEVIVRT